MSTQINGTAIRRISAAMVTEDGQNVLLRLDPVAGPEMILALPTAQISGLIQLAAQCVTRAREKAGADPQVKEAFVVDEWDVHQGPSDRLVLVLNLAAGGELAFQLPAGAQQPMIDKLSSSQTPSTVDPSRLN